MSRHEPADNPPDLAKSELVLSLLTHKDRREFFELLDGHSELLSGSMEYTLGRCGERPDGGLPFRLLQELVRGARTDPAGAYRAYQQRKEEVNRAAEQLQGELEAIDVAMNQGRFDHALAVIAVAMRHARIVGSSFREGRLFDARGRAYWRSSNGDRVDNIERAIEAFEHALAHVPPDAPTSAAGTLMHLGLAYAERLRGDRRENLEDSIGVLRRALTVLQTLEGAAPPDDLAVVRTNLANALLRREAGDDSANASEAVEQCRAALEHRSPDRDITDWAHTQATLGAAMAQLARLPSAPSDGFGLARAAFWPLVAHASQIPDPWHAGLAHRLRGRLYVDEAQHRAKGGIELGPAGEFAKPLDGELLAHARMELECAATLVHEAPDHTLYGRTLTDLAEVLSGQGETDPAIKAALAALETLRPTTAPRECLKAAEWGGYLLADAGRWAEAAAVYRDAVEAAELLFHSRLETGSREEEIRNIGEVPRWAAVAIARTGECLEAALVLEAGRTRELRRRLGLESVGDELDELPAELRGAYEQAAAGLAASPLGSGGSVVARRFQEVLAAIRRVDGFEGFGAGASPRDLVAAVEPGWPVIYVVPAPHGTMLLCVSGDGGGGQLEARVRFIDGVTGVHISHRIVGGDPQWWPERADGLWPRSYFAGISDMKMKTPGKLDFCGALDDLLSWLGEAVARPIRQLLDEVDATGVTLIPCGPIAPAPLHAAVWNTGGQPQCLLDEIDVRYAPSAVVAAAARRLAVQHHTTAPVLVALGDPTCDLRAAAGEVAEIARRFGGGSAIRAVHENADSTFLREHASDAQFLHLACHARGGLLDRDVAAVNLADGWRSAFDLTALPRLTTRLVTVSACQSAHANYMDLREEAFSLGTAMVVAGSACAIASLWLVDDEATALLMIRLYDEILGGCHRPPEALRRAQQWLRDLTCVERGAFLVMHPAIHNAFRERDEERTRDARNDLADSCEPSGDDRPYAHPEFWAAFVAIGV